MAVQVHVSRVLCIASYVGIDILVFPAASRPSINKRISFDPKILFINFEMFPPISAVLLALRA